MGDARHFDIFFSHAREDWLDPVKGTPMQAMVAALEAAGLRVFRDEAEISDGQSITRRITEGLGRSRLLLAWYSATYPARRACQWELTAAILAAERDDTLPHAMEQRILVLNPEVRPERPGEMSVDHIHPITLRDQRATPTTGRNWAAFAQDVRQRLARVTTPFGSIRAGARAPWYGSPERFGSPRFVGRVRDLWAVHSGLMQHNVALISGARGGSAGTVQVQGMGGIGKTLLAEEYAIRFAGGWPGGVFWLSAATGSALDVQQRSIAEHFRLHIQGLKPEEIASLLRAALEQRERYLWVVDDLPATAGQPDLLAWKAPTPNGHTLVTTRSRRLAEVTFTHTLDRLDEDDAYTLLTDRRKPTTAAEEAAAREILTLLDNHALAVDVAGAAIRTQGYGYFLELLRNPSEDALDFAAKLADELPTGHTPYIAATLLDSVKRLEADEDLRQGMRVLYLAALLAPAPIPKTFIANVFGQLAYDERAGWKQATLGVKAVTNESLGKHLLATDDQPDSLSVHILVSHTLHHHGDVAPDGMRGAVVTVLRNLFAEHAEDIRNHTSLLPLLPHARLLTDGALDEAGASLLGLLGKFAYERGSYRTAVVDFRRQMQTRTNFLGLEHPDTLASQNDLAEALRSSGDFQQAQSLHERVLEIRRRVQGLEHPDTLTSMNELALSLWSMGDLQNARQLEEQVLRAHRRVLGPEHPDTLRSMNNLAETLRYQGDLLGARSLHEQAQEPHRRVLGLEHPDTLKSMNNLAETLRLQGDLQGAQRLHETVLEIRCRVLVPEHPDTLTSMNNLALTLRFLGDLQGARNLHEQELTICSRVLGPDHPDVLKSMNNLAETLRSLDDLLAAQYLHRQVLDARCRTLGSDHSDTLTSMDNLACTLRLLGDFQEARTLQERTLMIRHRLLGSDHPDTLTSLNNMADVLASMGDYLGARTLGEQVLETRRRVLGSEHPDTLTTMHNLAVTLLHMGEVAPAQALVATALPVAQVRYPQVAITKALVGLMEHLRTIAQSPQPPTDLPP